MLIRVLVKGVGHWCCGVYLGVAFSGWLLLAFSCGIGGLCHGIHETDGAD